MIDLSIVIPTFNEEKYIRGNLVQLEKFLHKITDDFEIIVVDDGSIDETCKIVDHTSMTICTKIQLISNSKNQGKGAVVKQGILASKGNFIFFTDADLPYNLSFVKQGLSELQNGYGMVVGSRYENGQHSNQNVPKIRSLASHIFRTIAHFLIRTEARDTQCGFKGFTKSVAKLIISQLRIKGFGFDIEVLFLANKYKIEVSNLPVSFSNSNRISRVKVIRDSINILVDTINVIYNNLLGRYD